MGRRSFTLLLLALAACTPRGEPAPPGPALNDASPRETRAIDPDALIGSWRIITLNGVAPRAVGEDAGGQRTPRISFGHSSYGGTSGCNFFGGLGLLEGQRFFTAPGPQTAMGCGELTAQEDVITGIMAAGPQVTLEDGSLRLSARQGAMVLRRAPELGSANPGPTMPATQLLAGTEWRILAMNGHWLQRPGTESGGMLRFEADGWQGRAACATLGGGWRQQGDRILLTGPVTTTEQLCPPQEAAFDARLGALMASRPRFTVGPNGELLVAGGDDWLIGERARQQRGAEATMTGTWRIARIDGAPPAREPALAFGTNGYSGTTGCNAIQGVFAARGRRLFTAPGPQTEQGCGPLTAQEERITGLLAASPQIAATAEGIALVDDKGRLELRRGATGFAGSAPRATRYSGGRLEAVLVALDGDYLQRHYSEPENRLRLSDGQWEVDLGCGQLGGVWRLRDGELHFFTDARAEPPRCGARKEQVRRLMRLMNGTAEVVIGEGDDLLVAGEENWLTGRVLRSTRKPR